MQYPNYKNVLYERGAIPKNLKCIIREARQRPNERGAIPKLLKCIMRERCNTQKYKCIIRESRQRPNERGAIPKKYKMYYEKIKAEA